jgi:hypothetical protein
MPAGDFRLLQHETGQAFDVRVTNAQRAGTRSLGAARI